MMANRTYLIKAAAVIALLCAAGVCHAATITWDGGGDGVSLFQEANWDQGGGDPAAGTIDKGVPCPHDLVIDIVSTVGGVNGWNGVLDLGGTGTLTVTNAANHFHMDIFGTATLKDGTVYFKAGNADFDFEGTWDNVDVTVGGSGIDVPTGTLALTNGTTVNTAWCAYNNTTIGGASVLRIRQNDNVFAWGKINLLDLDSKIIFTGGKTTNNVITDHLSGDTNDPSTTAAGRILVNGNGAKQGINVNVYADPGTGYTTVHAISRKCSMFMIW